MLSFTEAAGVCWGLFYVLLGIAVLLLSKAAAARLSPYKIDKELVQADNFALGLAMSGYYAGVLIIFIAAASGDNGGAAKPFAAAAFGAAVDFAYAVFGILALNLSRTVVDWAILGKFSLVKEIVADRNAGVGAVEAGTMTATALAIAGAVHGQGGPLPAAVFFAASLLLLILFSRFHALLTPYDDYEEIVEKDNAAAGACLGFSLTALGIIVFKAAAGDFVSWTSGFSWFLIYGALGFLGLAALQRLTRRLFLADADLAEEICRDRNLNVAWISGTLSLGFAALIFFML